MKVNIFIILCFGVPISYCFFKGLIKVVTLFCKFLIYITCYCCAAVNNIILVDININDKKTKIYRSYKSNQIKHYRKLLFLCHTHKLSIFIFVFSIRLFVVAKLLYNLHYLCICLTVCLFVIVRIWFYGRRFLWMLSSLFYLSVWMYFCFSQSIYPFMIMYVCPFVCIYLSILYLLLPI